MCIAVGGEDIEGHRIRWEEERVSRIAVEDIAEGEEHHMELVGVVRRIGLEEDIVVGEVGRREVVDSLAEEVDHTAVGVAGCSLAADSPEEEEAVHMVVAQEVRRRVVDLEEGMESLVWSVIAVTPHFSRYSRDGGGAPYP